jgi:hypothetical protein
MTNKQGLGGESIGLNVDIRSCNFVDETTLPNIWIATDKDGSSIGIY